MQLGVRNIAPRRVDMRRIFCAIAIVVLIGSFADSHATNYYLSPSGKDTNAGTSKTTAWATLNKAESFGLQPGDTLFIMGGHYYNQQYSDVSPYTNGTRAKPVVFKAYGDSVAVFQGTGATGDEYSRLYFKFGNGQDYIVIDGFSSLNPADSLFLKMGYGESDGKWMTGPIQFYGYDGRFTGCVVRGCELTGYAPGRGSYEVGAGYCIGVLHADSMLIQSNYIHNFGYPDGSEQSGGEAVFMQGSRFCKIERNTVKYTAHGSFLLGEDNVLSGGCKYITIKNNYIENHWGGGIYVNCNTSYCLIEGNVITHCGESTTYPKPAIQLSGPHNVIRKNVIYNPLNQPISMEAQWGFPAYWCHRVDSCLIYNNTIFKTGRHYSIVGFVKNHVTGAGCPTASLKDNGFYNNIFYKSQGKDPYQNFESEVVIDCYFADEDHNMITPDNSTSRPSSTHWNGNYFHNNCIRRNDLGAAHSQLIAFGQDSHYGGNNILYSLNSVQAEDPTAWSGNIGDDPKLLSESPDTYGLNRGWWRLTSASPCIDAGVPVNDYIGAFVRSIDAAYGWSNLGYRGSRPDIGAFEYDSENPASPTAPQASIHPTTR
jgi:hypothetical protein